MERLRDILQYEARNSEEVLENQKKKRVIKAVTDNLHQAALQGATEYEEHMHNRALFDMNIEIKNNHYEFYKEYFEKQGLRVELDEEDYDPNEKHNPRIPMTITHAIVRFSWE